VPLLGITGNRGLHLPGETREELLRAIAPYFVRLTPVAAVEEAVRAFRDTHFAGPVLGVHIRRGDHGDLLKRLDLPQATEADHWAYVDACLAAVPDLRVFCASDDAEVKRRFLQHVGDRGCGYEAQALDRHTLRGVQDALIDLLLLSHTTFICGALGSSFDSVAALRNLAQRGALATCVRRLQAGVCDDAERLSDVVTRTLSALSAAALSASGAMASPA
jgi:hypothetical protein